jgi:hypothetical protein
MRKYEMKRFKLWIQSVLPGIIPTPALPVQQLGALPDPTGLSGVLAALASFGASFAGGVNFTTSSGSTATWTNLANALFRYTVGSAVTVTIDSAYNIAKALGTTLTVGQQFTFQCITNAATTVATPTLSDTAVTLSGTTTMVAAALRFYQGVITQVYTIIGSTLTTGTTFTSIAQIGTTNNYTVTLGTNAIVPVVGNAFYLGTTTGTLPAGWYPINAAASATSFVIAAPVNAVAWTCTAANLISSSVCPSTYSPLITITGLMTTVTGTMAV